MGILLYEHNKQAYHDAITMLAKTGKAAIVHPTGTGKSYVAFKLAEENSASKVFWLSPSEYIYKTQVESLGTPLPNITFCTYAKLAMMPPEEIVAIQADYIILDEFHRCGAEKWGAGVQALLNTHLDTKVLGLSATNIRYLDNQRNMADELFDGNIASEMSLGEAIVRGILPAPTYVTSVYSYSKELDKYQRRITGLRNQKSQAEAEQYLEALRRALQNADGLDEIFAKHMKNRAGKYLVFCANFDHLREMQEHTQEWFKKVDTEPHVYTAYSDDPETSQAFTDFKADESEHLKLLYCIDMLNEGIHVAGVDGVILFRPTVSPIIYKQQIGRALSAGTNKEPIIFDIVNNFDNLYSISSIEKEMMNAACRFYGSESAAQIVEERFHLFDEVRSCREIFGQMQECIDASWDYYYQAAAAYYKEYKDLLVPRRYKTEDGLALGSWILTQRRIRAGKVDGMLTPERAAKLDTIGMNWGSTADLAWAHAYDEACAYKEEYGNLLVPARYVAPSGFKLGSWITNLRQAYSTYGETKRLDAVRLQKMNDLGMAWDAVSYQWEANYAEAARYFAQNGNLDVPIGYQTDTGFMLGRWLGQLRVAHNGKGTKSAPLTSLQAERLNAIGMQWGNRSDAQWMRMYDLAKQYHAQHDDLNIPVAYITPDGQLLGKWIARQRNARNRPEKSNTRLTKERIALLDSIGMNWGTQDPWQYRYNLVLEYKREHGDININAKYKTRDGIWLGNWLYHQRRALQDREPGVVLAAEQTRLLQNLGLGGGSKRRITAKTKVLPPTQCAAAEPQLATR